MSSKEFKTVVASFLSREREKRSMTLKEFSKLTKTNPKTAHKREYDGIVNYIELVKILESLKYDPELKLKELRSNKTNTEK